MQKLKISIYDVDSSRSSLDGADSLGFVECNLGQVVQRLSFVYKVFMVMYESHLCIMLMH